MNKTKKNIIKIAVAVGILGGTASIFANLNWMQASNYWFAGYMYIEGNQNLSYNMYAWNNNSKKMELSETPFTTNTVINVRDLLGSIGNCPYMWWGGDPATATKVLLVPSLPLGSAFTKGSAQQGQKDLKAGKIAPYIVIERAQNTINIFIIGPVFSATSGTPPETVIQFVSRKLAFNFLPFEKLWVSKSRWYNNLDTHWPTGIAFAFSLTIDLPNRNAYFFNSPDANEYQFDINKPQKKIILSDDAFYVYGLEKDNDALGWSWTHQGPENNNLPISTITYQYTDANNKIYTKILGIDERCADGGPVIMNKSCKICDPNDPSKCNMYKPIRFDDIGMTTRKLQEQGILNYQSSLSPDELQRIITWINSTGQGNFESVL